MEFLGTVAEITAEGRIVIKCAAVPDPGDHVFDSRQKKIGSVKRIFGPVESPYVSVVPSDGTIVKTIGMKTFFEGAVRHGKNKRRN